MKEFDDLLAKDGPGSVVVFAGLAIYVFLGGSRGGPCRRCRHERCVCPPLACRTAGPWRGHGSFGKAPFGSQVSHRR